MHWLLLAACAPEPIVEASAISAELVVPIFGGTMAMDGDDIVAADPEHAQLWFVDASERTPSATMLLEPNDQPFRIVLTAAHALVTVRGAGAVVAVDRDTHEEVARTAVCAEPRGLEVDGDRTMVACASGELVTLDAALNVVDSWFLEPDLRDVVVQDGEAWISRFRSAEVLRVDLETREVLERSAPSFVGTLDGSVLDASGRDPTLAWRMRPFRDGVVVLHQAALLRPIQLGAPHEHADPDAPTEAYGGPVGLEDCAPDAVVTAHLTRFERGEVATGGPLSGVVLGVDFDIGTGQQVVIAAAGTASSRPRIVTVGLSRGLETTSCVKAAHEHHSGDGLTTSVATSSTYSAFFVRGPSQLRGRTTGTPLPLPDVPTMDSGRALSFERFHKDAGQGISCASCHPEGQEDGHAWDVL